MVLGHPRRVDYMGPLFGARFADIYKYIVYSTTKAFSMRYLVRVDNIVRDGNLM